MSAHESNEHRSDPRTGAGVPVIGRGTKVQTPFFPTYSEVRALLPIFTGEPKEAVRSMIQAVMRQTGTPKNPLDWSDPDAWIQERLTGADAALAQRIWGESGRTVNPRHVYGSYLFVNTFDLLEPGADGHYRLTEFGRAFRDGEDAAVRPIDVAEGVPELLAIVQAKQPARRGDMLPDWAEFLHESSTYQADSTAKSTLRDRLLNVLDRGLLTRDGVYYSLTPKGEDVLAQQQAEAEPEADASRTARRTVRTANDGVRAELRDRLERMHPFAFEGLVRDLLDAMGYEDVTVTKESGDRGVDVVGRVQFGITAVIEVVQVKRHKANIRRPVLDQLRGVLPYHGAIRGTIITIGGFSPGCAEAATFPGAAPITLIDGDRLIELLVEHDIGVRKRALSLLEIDEEALLASPEDEQVPAAEEL